MITQPKGRPLEIQENHLLAKRKKNRQRWKSGFETGTPRRVRYRLTKKSERFAYRLVFLHRYAIGHEAPNLHIRFESAFLIGFGFTGFYRVLLGFTGFHRV